MGKHLSFSRTLNIGAPQGCVLSLLLYSLYTRDCLSTSDSNTTVKFADNTAVVCLISNNNEEDYLMEVNHLEDWCRDNSHLLNISKTKVLVVDYSRKQQRNCKPLRISRTEVERVESFVLPEGQLHIGPDMDLPHQHPGKEGSTASLPPQTPQGL